MPGAADVVSLLGKDLRKPDGTTIPTSDALKGKGVLALYFSAHWCPPCRGFTPTLCKKYKALQDAGKEFEMVFVSSDRDEDAFKEYHGEMPFMALPYDLRDEKNSLSKIFKVNGIPTLAFYDLEKKEIITSKGRGAISDDSFIETFPYRPKSLMELLGEDLRKPDGTTVPTSDALKGKGVLALYFSAHWCPPCRGFTPTLCKKYKALQDAGKEFEMVFVSSDRDEDAFNEYHGEMPFMALPYVRRADKQALSELFDVSGIPTLVLVDLATNKTITTSGRGPISSSTFIEDFPYYPKPVNDFGESLEGINDEPSLVVFMQSSSADKKKELLAALNKIAVAQFKKPEKEWEVSRFFTANQEGPVAKVRSLCKMETVLTAHEHPLEKSDENAGWGCDGCSSDGDGKDRYRCTAGCDFDFCGNCNENAKKATKKPAADMVILDLENGQFFRCEATEVTEDSIRAFMKDFKQGNALGVSIR